MDDFSSHLKILEFIIDKFDIRSVFETGCGDFSTKLFLDKAKKVVSLETQNQSWFEKINSEFGNKKNYLCNIKLDFKGIYDFLGGLEKFDLCFVDGRCDRFRQVNYLFKKSNILVAHDTEANIYLWDRVDLPYDFLWIDIVEKEPWTSVITNRMEVFRSLQEKFQIEVYDRKSFPFKRYLIDNKSGLSQKDFMIQEGKL